jgi:hypothetical protein
LTTDVLALAIEAPRRRSGSPGLFLYQEKRMKRRSEPGLFQPKLSASETKGDATTRVAQAITDAETNARDAKTERLRTARLAKEATEGPPPGKLVRRKQKPAGQRG